MTQISMSGVAVEFGADTLFSDLTFTVGRGERWGVVGRNGTGKTTLFRLLTGEMLPSRGAMARAPGLRITLLEQHRDFGDAATVWEAAAGQFAHLVALERSLTEQTTALAEHGEASTPQMLARYDRDLERFEREGGYTFAPRVDAVLQGLGFDADEARTRPLSALSGGERGRVGLARQLVAPADVLLLDEPTNHLDLETTAWLEQYLRNANETIILISHDRAFLEAVADHVLHFEAGSAFAYSGGYSAFVQQREERRLAQQRTFEQQRRSISREQDYIRRNIAGQNSRQAKGRRKRLARLPRLSPPPGAEGVMSLRLEPRERGGEQVVVADNAHVAVEGRTLLRDFTGILRRGEVVGLIGANGTGKSTLLRTLVGDHPLEGGRLELGGSVTPAFYRQDLSQVPVNRSLYDVIADLRPGWERGMVLGHLARFGFTGDDVQRNATTLSGGERARVALAMIMLSGANLLMLDEPTNHLDVESIEAIEDAVEAFDGTVILISHDRALLRALTTRVWLLHDTRVTDFPGGFDEWEVVSAERAHAASVAAAEEEQRRRMHEKQRTRRSPEAGRGADAREAQRRVEQCERLVESMEARLTSITKALEDPDLYATPEGIASASALGIELERAREALDAALAQWESATEAVPK
jgi:ATP-binding cassette, subfamily F, member 3